MTHNVPVQSLIDHIKTSLDVDPWAKEMAEELLKEQQQQIWELQDQVEYLTDKQKTANLYKCPNCGTWVSAKNVVRCKDCIKRKSDKCLLYWNEIKDDETWDDDWYCADGERRDKADE